MTFLRILGIIGAMTCYGMAQHVQVETTDIETFQMRGGPIIIFCTKTQDTKRCEIDRPQMRVPTWWLS